MIKYLFFSLLSIINIVDNNSLTVKVRNSKNFQEQFQWENATYILKGNYDLNAMQVELPYGSTLVFKKGKLQNGIIVGDKTTIDAGEKTIFNNDLLVEGTWICDIHPEWFGAKGDGISDDTEYIQRAANIAKNTNLVFNRKSRYVYKKSISIKSGTTIVGNGASFIKECYSALFRNEHSNEDIEDNDIVISGINGQTRNNSCRGLWLWMTGVNNLKITNCTFENHTPLDQNNQSQWCMTVSGEDIDISDCYINTKGGGLFSDGIHVFYAKNCTISNCSIMTDDDCISFTPEIPNEQQKFKKYNKVSENIQIKNVRINSTRNCIRFEIRDNAPKIFSYNRVTVKDITINYGEDESGGSIILLHDYREDASSQNSYFEFDNIELKGYNTGSRRNCVEIFGEHPEKIPDNICNFTDIEFNNIVVKSGNYDNFFRSIGTNNLTFSNCQFLSADKASCSVSIRNSHDVTINHCRFSTSSPYPFIALDNSSCIMNDNVITRNGDNNSGIAIDVDKSSHSVILKNNAIHNFAIGVNAFSIKEEGGKYFNCATKVKRKH